MVMSVSDKMIEWLIIFVVAVMKTVFVIGVVVAISILMLINFIIMFVDDRKKELKWPAKKV